MWGTLSVSSPGCERPYLTVDPAEPLVLAMLVAHPRHELHADADAEEGHAPAQDGVLQRFDHAVAGGQPGLAVGEGADARQHDPLRVPHPVGIVRHQQPASAGARRPPRRARRPWRRSAELPEP